MRFFLFQTHASFFETFFFLLILDLDCKNHLFKSQPLQCSFREGGREREQERTSQPLNISCVDCKVSTDQRKEKKEE